MASSSSSSSLSMHVYIFNFTINFLYVVTSFVRFIFRVRFFCLFCCCFISFSSIYCLLCVLGSLSISLCSISARYFVVFNLFMGTLIKPYKSQFSSLLSCIHSLALAHTEAHGKNSIMEESRQ